MPRRDLTDYDFCKAAKAIGCEPEYVKAVATVESRGSGFYDDGFPTILFERHKFYKHADRAKRDEWTAKYPDICNPKATPRGGYGTKSAQRSKFNAAFALDAQAAMMACSWGAFQELGENYDDYDFASVDEFVDMMKSGIGGQLEIFIRSIKHRGLADEMRRHDSRGFARNYNGPDFERFHYDTQIDSAFKLVQKHPIDCAKVIAPSETDDHNPLAQFTVTHTDAGDAGQTSTDPDPAGSNLAAVKPALNSVEPSETKADAVSQDPASAAVSEEPKPKLWDRLTDRMTSWQGKLDRVNTFKESLSPISGSSKATFLTTKIGGWVMIALGFFGDHWLMMLIGTSLIALAVWYLSQAKKNAAARAGNSQQTQSQTVIMPPAEK